MAITHIVTTETQPWRTQAVTAAGAGAGTNLALNGQKHQTVRGFGGCFNELGAEALGKLPAAKRKQVLEAMFGDEGCRFNFRRLPIGASDYALEWYRLNENDGDYGMEKYSVARDERYLIPLFRPPKPRRRHTHAQCRNCIINDLDIY